MPTAVWQNQQKEMRAQRRLGSVWACAVRVEEFRGIVLFNENKVNIA